MTTVPELLANVLFKPLGLAEAGLEVTTASSQALFDTAPKPGTDSAEAMAAARAQLQYVGLGALALVSAPVIYAASMKKIRKKSRLTKRQERIGVSLENASQQATGVMMTALAAPALSAAAAYILIQKLEDAQYISRSLGNATQALLTVAAAGPAIQGIGQIATSAFRGGKK